MFAESRAAFFTDFAVTATVGGVALSGIFDAQYADAFGLIAGTVPALLIDDDDAPDVAAGDVVSVGGRGYLVAVVQPDGTGMSRLILEAAS